MDEDRSATPGSKWLFVTCFIALVATSFAFLIRAFTIGDWAADFGLSETQQGELFGAGLWPFAISIILFSLVIDRIGYGVSMGFAFACHVLSVAITLLAPMVLADPLTADPEAVRSGQAAGYWVLYAGMFVAGLAAGTVEAVINPVIATVYAHHKTKWLNILHAGWPGGFVLAGLLALGMNEGNPLHGLTDWGSGWEAKVALLLIPTAIYGAMMLRARFPVNERVVAGVSYREMLSEVGGVGAFVSVGLVFWEIERVLRGFVPDLVHLPPIGGWPVPLAVIPTALVGLIVLVYTRSLGRPLFVFLLLVMVLLATTELGTDTWIKELMGPPMAEMSLDGGWVLIYSATVMVLLRLFAGPIVKLLNPVGLLLISCLFAAAGLMFLSTAAGAVILVAATVYAIGQTFFWPTTLGLVSERFPRGGALTLNAIAGVGMLGVGILGAPLLGYIQNSHIQTTLEATDAQLAGRVLGTPKSYLLGEYQPVDDLKLAALDERSRKLIDDTRDEAKQSALFKVAALPLIMFVCYLALWLYFRMNGGYRAEQLPVTTEAPPKDFRPV